MQLPACDVVGCRKQAAWKIAPSRETDQFEEYLCPEHFQQLLRGNPRLAARYSALTGEADAAPEYTIDMSTSISTCHS